MARAFIPPVQHGMKILNREAFKKTVSTLAMRVQAKHVGGLMKNLSRFSIIIFYLLIELNYCYVYILNFLSFI